MRYQESIELILRSILKCERFGIGGMIDADNISASPMNPIVFALGYLYANANTEKRQLIEKFLENYKYFLEMSIIDLLSLKSVNEIIKITNNSNFKNGEDCINNMIQDLKELYN